MDTDNLNDALSKARLDGTGKMSASMARQHYAGRELKVYGDPGTKFAAGSTMKEQYPAYGQQPRTMNYKPPFEPNTAPFEGTRNNDYPAYENVKSNPRHMQQKPITPLPFEGTRNNDYPAHEVTQINQRHMPQKPITPKPFEGTRNNDYPAHEVTQINQRHMPQKPITPRPFEGTRKNDYPAYDEAAPERAHAKDQLPMGGKFEGTRNNDYPAYGNVKSNPRHMQQKPMTPLPFEGTRKNDYPAYEVTQVNQRHLPQKPITPLPFEGTRKNDYPAYEVTQVNQRHMPQPMLPTLPFEGNSTSKEAFKGWQMPPKRPALGVQMINDKAYVLIPANAPLPAMGRQTFTTVRDNQTAISVLVLEGDFQIASKCGVLGQFDLEGIPIAPEGVPRIQVTFMINKQGVLTCHAMDLDTKRHEQWLKKGSFTVTPSPGNSNTGSKPVSR